MYVCHILCMMSYVYIIRISYRYVMMHECMSHIWCDYVSASVFQMIDALAWEKGENMREHEKTAGGSRKGKKSRRHGFLFSSLWCMMYVICWCPLSALMYVCVLLCVCVCFVCVWESLIFYVMVSHLSIKGVIDLELTHHHHTYRMPDRCARTTSYSELFKNISIFLLKPHVYTYPIHNYYCIPFAPPRPAPHTRRPDKIIWIQENLCGS